MLVPTGTDMLCLSGVTLTVQLQAETKMMVSCLQIAGYEVSAEGLACL
jgi:hypothetical protein